MSLWRRRWSALRGALARVYILWLPGLRCLVSAQCGEPSVQVVLYFLQIRCVPRSTLSFCTAAFVLRQCSGALRGLL